MVHFLKAGPQLFFQEFKIQNHPDLIELSGLYRYLHHPIMPVQVLALAFISP
jgi:hypothetical protein